MSAMKLNQLRLKERPKITKGHFNSKVKNKLATPWQNKNKDQKDKQQRIKHKIEN